MSDKKPAALVIPLTACKSSSVSAHGYDATSKTLAIKFSNGAVHQYTGVPPEKADELGKAKSIGRYFASDIRNAFKSVKQEEIKPKAGAPR